MAFKKTYKQQQNVMLRWTGPHNDFIITKIEEKTVQQRWELSWVTWVHANFRVYITDKLVTEFSCNLQFARIQH